MMESSRQPCSPQAVIDLIEYHNQPTVFGWFTKIDCPDFHLQQLPLNEVQFALLMSDFFVTFDVCSQNYDEARYFPAARLPHSPLSALAGRLGLLSEQPCRPLTVAMLYQAASLGRWPDEG